MQIVQPTDDAIARACAMLHEGKLVAFPTETVYGLGADATNALALKRLYEAKGRPCDHPVIVHLAFVEQMNDWCRDFPKPARLLAERFCPGPLTFILPKAAHVLAQVTGGQDKVGLRIPSHPAAHRLLAAFGKGLAAPSANKFGKLSPTTAQDVACDFAQELSMVLDGGASQVGIESTIVDFTVEPPRVLRPGMISAGQIAAVIGEVERAAPAANGNQTRAPGMLEKHYAPATALELVSGDRLQSRLQALEKSGRKAAVLAFQEGARPASRTIVASADPARYAHELYSNLRELDRLRADIILVETVPDEEIWAGVADRLRRASTKASRGESE